QFELPTGIHVQIAWRFPIRLLVDKLQGDQLATLRREPVLFSAEHSMPGRYRDRKDSLDTVGQTMKDLAVPSHAFSRPPPHAAESN
ncbi:MAG: hypothetical protein AAGA03_08625, partial [Planctomycetota bacterium]